MPSRRTLERYHRDGLRLVTEPGSQGWRGYFILGTGDVTRVESIAAGIATFGSALHQAANLERGDRMRAHRWLEPGVTHCSSGSTPTPAPLLQTLTSAD